MSVALFAAEGVERDGAFVPFPTVTADTPPTKWRFLVEDIMSGTVLGEIPFTGTDFEDALNRPGGQRHSLPADHPKATDEWLDEGRRAIYIERDGKILHGGPLWSVTRPMGSRTLNLEVGGWLGYWDHRQIWTSRTFTATEQFNIFQTLITDAQAVGLGAGADLGIGVEWDAASGVLRDRLDGYRDYDAKNLGEALRQLAAVENGFDFGMTYELDPVTDTIIKRIRLYYPTRGRDTGFLFQFHGGHSTTRMAPDPLTIDGLPVFVDGDPLTVGEVPHSYAASGLRSNITRWGVTRDASAMAWRVRGWGDGFDADRISSPQIDESLRGVYPFLDADLTQFSSVSEQATLDENTMAALARMGHSQRLPAIEIDPAMHPRFGDWEIGDTVHLRIDDGYGSVSPRPTDTAMPVRILGYRINARTDRPVLALEEA